MPDDVRRAYQEMLDQLRDTDADGIPDVLQGGGAGNALHIQSSITSDGLGSLPEPMRRLIENAMGPANSGKTPRSELKGKEPFVQALDTVGHAIGGGLGVLLAFVASFTLVSSVGLMFAIGGGQSHLAGRLTVAIPALLILGWLDTQATRLARRREPLLRPYSAGYRRYALLSAWGLLVAAALLLGLAWFLP
jgi:hypothetical protein